MPVKKLENEKRSIDVSTMKRVQSEQFVSVYANNANLLAIDQDVRLLFGQIFVHPDAEPQIVDTASVTMTWDHAARLRDLLTRAIETRE